MKKYQDFQSDVADKVDAKSLATYIVNTIVTYADNDVVPFDFLDSDSVGENLYLAAETLGLGTCGIGAVSLSTNKALGLDGDDELLVYAQPVVWPNTEEKNEEAMFYSFVEEEGL